MTFDEQVRAVADLGFTEPAGRLPRAGPAPCGGVPAAAVLRLRRHRARAEDPRLLRPARGPAVRHALHWPGTAGRGSTTSRTRSLYRAIGDAGHPAPTKPWPSDRAVERLMVLDHVLADRDVHWLAGEQEKVEHFTRTTPLRPEELPSLTFGHGTDTTTRYFPDKLPIGVVADGRHVFLYLVERRRSRSTSGASCIGTASCSGPCPSGRSGVAHAGPARGIAAGVRRGVSGRTGPARSRRPSWTNWPGISANCAPGRLAERLAVRGRPAALRRPSVPGPLPRLAGERGPGASRHGIRRPGRRHGPRTRPAGVPRAGHRYAHLTPLVGRSGPRPRGNEGGNTV